MKKITFLLILFITNLGFAQPSTSPAAPTNNAADVVSIYGDTYTNIANNYDPNATINNATAFIIQRKIK